MILPDGGKREEEEEIAEKWKRQLWL